MFIIPAVPWSTAPRDYSESIAGVAQLLGLQLDEVDDWNCCGATAAHSINDYLALALPARNLVRAEKQGQEVVVPCACVSTA